jgi:hypothetical protein
MRLTVLSLTMISRVSVHLPRNISPFINDDKAHLFSLYLAISGQKESSELIDTFASSSTKLATADRLFCHRASNSCTYSTYCRWVQYYIPRVWKHKRNLESCEEDFPLSTHRRPPTNHAVRDRSTTHNDVRRESICIQSLRLSSLTAPVQWRKDGFGDR